MVKNYLVGSVRPIIKKWYSADAAGARIDNPNRDEDARSYREMYRISRSSARAFLLGDWEEVCHEAPCLDARLFQIAQWYLVKEMWHREPCNILCMGSDTMFVQPTEIFGKWSTMRLFNYTDPRNHREFPNYFNDDVRYFPHDMDPAIWELGERRMIDWFDHAQAHWDCGQLIHNSMFWAQSIPDDDRLHPYLNWMSTSLSPKDIARRGAAEQWNRCTLDLVRILHFHGSRGPEATRALMTMWAESAGVKL